MTEYSIKSLGFAENFDIMLMHTDWKNFYTGYVGAPAAEGSPAVGQIEDATQTSIYLGFEDIGRAGINLSYSGLYYQAVDSGLPDLKKRSYSYLVNLNMIIPKLYSSIWGVEYLHTELYHYMDDLSKLNILPFGNIQNSDGFHYFVSFPLDKKITSRFGYYRLEARAGDVFQTEGMDAYSYYAELRFNL